MKVISLKKGEKDSWRSATFGRFAGFSQISLLVLSGFGRLSHFCSPLKSSENRWFSDDFGGGGIEVN